MYPPNHRPRILVRRGSDRAGIQNDEISVGIRNRSGETPQGELLFDRSSIRLRRPTAKVVHKKRRHCGIITIRDVLKPPRRMPIVGRRRQLTTLSSVLASD
jgi:hypothetical protein